MTTACWLPGNLLIFSSLSLLDAGLKPNSDTLTCALFSGLPHYSVTRLLDMGADTTHAKMHVEHSSMHHPVRSRIKEEHVKNLTATSTDAFAYAEKNLSHIKEKYGPFHGLAEALKVERKQQEREQQQEQMGQRGEGHSREEDFQPKLFMK